MELHAQNRTIFGKRTKRLRRDGFIPAELYGHQLQNVHLAVPAKAFAGIHREAGAYTVITLVTENGEKVPALIASVELDPISHEFLAIDFRHIRRDERVKVKIPIEFTGGAPAVKAGYLVIAVLTELEVETFPGELPRRFHVDVSSLSEIGQNIHVGDLTIPAGVKVLVPPDTVLVTVAERRKEETPEAAPAAATAEATSPASTGEATTSPPGEKREVPRA